MLDAIARACPSFHATAPPRCGRKSVLVRGVVDGISAVAKLVRSPRSDRAWTYYLANEIAVLRAFALARPPLPVPRLLAHSDEVLVREWLDAPPLARTRQPSLPLGDRLAPLVAGLGRLDRYHASLGERGRQHTLTPAPTPAQRHHMRQHLLEDPTDPSWCAAALRSAESAGIVPPGTTAHLEPALASLPTQFAHGDLLLRNVLRDGSVIDWECAGHHPAGWDLALLSTQLAPTEQHLVRQQLSPGQHALVVVAVCREVWFRARHGDTTALRDQLAQALDAVHGVQRLDT